MSCCEIKFNLVSSGMGWRGGVRRVPVTGIAPPSSKIDCCSAIFTKCFATYVVNEDVDLYSCFVSREGVWEGGGKINKNYGKKKHSVDKKSNRRTWKLLCQDLKWKILLRKEVWDTTVLSWQSVRGRWGGERLIKSYVRSIAEGGTKFRPIIWDLLLPYYKLPRYTIFPLGVRGGKNSKFAR